jgi:hypothetical protein
VGVEADQVFVVAVGQVFHPGFQAAGVRHRVACAQVEQGVAGQAFLADVEALRRCRPLRRRSSRRWRTGSPGWPEALCSAGAAGSGQCRGLRLPARCTGPACASPGCSAHGHSSLPRMRLERMLMAWKSSPAKSIRSSMRVSNTPGRAAWPRAGVKSSAPISASRGFRVQVRVAGEQTAEARRIQLIEVGSAEGATEAGHQTRQSSSAPAAGQAAGHGAAEIARLRRPAGWPQIEGALAAVAARSRRRGCSVLRPLIAATPDSRQPSMPVSHQRWIVVERARPGCRPGCGG